MGILDQSQAGDGLLPLRKGRLSNTLRLLEDGHTFYISDQQPLVPPAYIAPLAHPADGVPSHIQPANHFFTPQGAPMQIAPAKPGAVSDTGIFDLLRGTNTSGPLTLMAFGGGLAQGGIGRALTAAASAGEVEQRQVRESEAQRAAYEGLLKMGVAPELAQAAALRPDVLRALAPEYFGEFKVVQTGEDVHGRKIFQLQGPGGKLSPIPEQNRESTSNSRASPERLKQTVVDERLPPSTGAFPIRSPITTEKSTERVHQSADTAPIVPRSVPPQTDQNDIRLPQISQLSDPESTVRLHELLASLYFPCCLQK
jgi:hypothetical protein